MWWNKCIWNPHGDANGYPLALASLHLQLANASESVYLCCASHEFARTMVKSQEFSLQTVLKTQPLWAAEAVSMECEQERYNGKRHTKAATLPPGSED